MSVFIDEAATATDTVDTLAAFVAFVDETVQALDSPTANAAFLAAVVEAINAMDAVTRRLLWEIIDDSQGTVWTLIDNA